MTKALAMVVLVLMGFSVVVCWLGGTIMLMKADHMMWGVLLFLAGFGFAIAVIDQFSGGDIDDG